MHQNKFIFCPKYQNDFSDSDFFITSFRLRRFQQMYDFSRTKNASSFVNNQDSFDDHLASNYYLSSTQIVQRDLDFIFSSSSTYLSLCPSDFTFNQKSTYINLYLTSTQNDSKSQLGLQQQVSLFFQHEIQENQHINKRIVSQGLVQYISCQLPCFELFLNIYDMQAIKNASQICCQQTCNMEQAFLCQKQFSNPYQENGQQIFQSSSYLIKSLQLYLYRQITQSIFEKIKLQLKIAIIQLKNQNLVAAFQILKHSEYLFINLAQSQTEQNLSQISQFSILNCNLLREVSLFKLRSQQILNYQKKIEIVYEKYFNLNFNFNTFSLINIKFYKAIRLYFIGKYDESLKIFQDCLVLAFKLLNKKNSYLCYIQNIIGFLYFRKGMFKKALQKIYLSIQFKGQEFVDDLDKKLFELISNFNLGIIYFHLKDYQKSKILFCEVQKSLNLCFDKSSICFSVVYVCLGNFKNVEGLYKQALHYFQMASQVLKKSKQPIQSKNNRFFAVLIGKTISFQNTNEHQLAWKVYLQLFQIALCVSKLNKHYLQDDFTFLKKSQQLNPQSILQILRKFDFFKRKQQVFPFTHPICFNLYYNICFFMSRYLKDYENSMKFLTFIEQLRQRYELVNFPQHAQLLKQIGFICYKLKLYQQSIQQFKKAAKIYKAIYGENCIQVTKLSQCIFQLKENIQTSSKNKESQFQAIDQQDSIFKVSCNAQSLYGFLSYTFFQ